MKFGILGADHPHALLIARHLVDSGAQAVAFSGADSPVAEHLRATLQLPTWPEARLLDTEAIDWIVCAGIPAQRCAAALSCLAAGKHVLAAKPALLHLDDVARVRAAAASAGRRFMVCFSERVLSRSTLLAARLLAAGEIGTLVHMTGFGPHRLDAARRPAWFFARNQAGGIVADLCVHQLDQFLTFAGITPARGHGITLTAARVARPAVDVGATPAADFDTFGELLVSGGAASAYIRVDWLSPAGLPTWGDVRLFLVGTGGTLEVRKNIDLQGRAGADHVLIANAHGVRYVNASDQPLTFGTDLINTPDAGVAGTLTTAHCLLASELAIRAQLLADAGRSQ